jgi:hypothetical protein
VPLSMESDMFLKAGVVLLVVWTIGVLGLIDIGETINMFLLVGLMLLLIAFMKARETATRPKKPGPTA